MFTSKLGKLLIIVGLLAQACVVTSCAGTKEPPTGLIDMTEYRKVVDQQKSEQAMTAGQDSSGQEMTPEEHEHAGDMDMQHRNYPLAGLHYDKALRGDPTRNGVRLKLGHLYLQQGMFEAALAQFQNLRAQDPNSAVAHRGIGYAFLMQHKWRDAEEALTKAIILAPSDWLSQNLLGLTYDQEQRYSEAITAYKAALALNPREPGVLNNLGLAYALNGDHDAAIHAYEQAVATALHRPNCTIIWALPMPIAGGTPKR